MKQCHYFITITGRVSQLLQYSLDHSTYTEQVKKQIDQVMKMVAVFGHDDLQSLIEQFMQKPSVSERNLVY